MNMKQNFDGIAYTGHFRDFQRQLLQKVDDILDNSRINLITAPGSNKKLLGLEIIRRMGNATVIITSSDNIGTHWSHCFEANFTANGAPVCTNEYFSHSLTAPALLTVVTYDTLHAAVNRLKVSETEDYTDVDLIRMVQENGIRTICLDEPHHLADQHRKALESLLGILGGEVHVLSLSSVPPYDLSSTDWERFVSLCGEINEEIFVPELVKAEVLCPHQDYVYFNYPAPEESAGIRGYRLRADEAVAEAMKLDFMAELNRRSMKLYHKNLDFLYSHYDEMLSLLMLLADYGYPVHRKLCRLMTRSNEMPPVTLQHAQIAFNFLLESQTMLRDAEKEALIGIFTNHRVMDHHRVYLATTHKIRRTLVSSVGKLDSLATITENEDRRMGDKLRELVVADEIHDHISVISSPEPLGRITPLSAFESIRKRCTWIPSGCMTTEAVILPDSVRFLLPTKYSIPADAFTATPIGTTGYASFSFRLTPESLCRLVLRLLNEGVIRVLVTTENALGEEWSIPCVNTLIPICSVASSTMVPYMRGNVLRTDKAFPDKTVHIWHIATVERDYSTEDHPALRLASRLSNQKTTIQSLDYEALSRRFNCFIAPGESDGDLESGIDRLSLIQPPYDKEGLDTINAGMLESASDRAKLKGIWKEAMAENTRPVAEVIVPKRAKVPVFTPMNILMVLSAIAALIFFSIYSYVSFYLILITFSTADIFFYAVMLFVLVVLSLLWGVYVILYMLPWFINHLTPRLSIRSLCNALLRALKEQGEIGKKARFVMELTFDKQGYRIYLDDCTAREQTLFQRAVHDMFSPIREPRYIMVRSSLFRNLRWNWSFACPEAVAQNDLWVKIFEKHLRMSMGLMKFQFTHRDPGRKYLIIARNKSYLNYYDIHVEKRLHILKRDRF